MGIIKLKLQDIYDEADNITYYVVKNENFTEALKGLENIIKNYETAQEIEDYIYDSFDIVDFDDIEEIVFKF